jgi:hypothetical protein
MRSGRFLASIRSLLSERRMGRNKKTRTKLAGLQATIDLHQQKIAQQKKGANPDIGLMKHWEKEVRAWQERSKRLRRRLPKEKT